MAAAGETTSAAAVAADLEPAAAPGGRRADETAAQRDRLARRGRQRKSLLLKVLGVLSIAFGWQVLSFIQPSFIAPSVPTILAEMWDIVVNERFFFHLYQTIQRVAAGFALAFVLAVVIGALMGLNRNFESFFEVHILTALMLPGLAWAIMAFMWLGISNWAAIVAIVFVSVPIIAVSVTHGTKAIDSHLTDMADVYGAGRWLKFRKVTLPQLYPYLFGAVRNGFALGWKVVVLSELLGLSNGVGYKVYEQYQRFNFTGVLSWTLLFALIMFLLEFSLFKPVERRLTRWRPDFAV